MMNSIECIDYISGTVGSGNHTTERPILFIQLRKSTSGSFPWYYYFEGSPCLNMQTYTVIRGRDDGNQDHFDHTISSFSLGTLSEDGKTITFANSFYGYTFQIYY